MTSATSTVSLWRDRAPRIDVDHWPARRDFDVIVVGAGLTGLATGVMLAGAGRRVIAVEARSVGAVTTGHTTGKISLLQGTQLSAVAKAHGEAVAQAYLDGSAAGQQWLLSFCAEHGVDVERRDAVSYVVDEQQVDAIRHEQELGRRLGLDLVDEVGAELPFEPAAGTRLAGQAQFDPMAAMAALTREFRRLGGVVVEQARVLDVRVQKRSTVITEHGELTADEVVLASGIPILDRGLYFAKLTPQRSYVVGFATPGTVPERMYLSVDSPTRSLRTATHQGRRLLLVGGNGHVVGRQDEPPTQLVADLVAWTQRWFPGAEPTHTWSAQDYQSHNHTPFVGKLPRGGGHVWIATGFSKWGMTGATMAALHLTGELHGHEPDWAGILSRRISRPNTVVEAVAANAGVAAATVHGWAATALHPLRPADRVPAEGAGVVGTIHGRPTAVSTVAGSSCAVSAVCTHLGGIVRYNDLEQTWDCPLHGSRFAADGTVLEGPATQPLKAHDHEAGGAAHDHGADGAASDAT